MRSTAAGSHCPCHADSAPWESLSIGMWRTKESHLHLLALAGGWPAAWLAQQTLRHKSQKAAFRAVYALTVVAHCGALAAWLLGLVG